MAATKYASVELDDLTPSYPDHSYRSHQTGDAESGSSRSRRITLPINAATLATVTKSLETSLNYANISIERTRTHWNSPSTRGKIFQHTLAIGLMLVFGLVPTIVFFWQVQNPWKPAPIECDRDTKGSEATGPAIRGLFIIDTFVFHLSFALAKLTDTAWDLIVGRGGQLLAGIVGYEVFNKALLRALETSPAPFRSFMALSVEGVSVSTAWMLSSDLLRHRTKRSTLIFIYMAASTAYILAIPTLFSAMGGYISAFAAYVRNGDGGLTPKGQFSLGEAFPDGWRIGLRDGECVTDINTEDSAHATAAGSDVASRYFTCNCELPNGTVADPREFPTDLGAEYYFGLPSPSYHIRYNYSDALLPYRSQDCTFNISENAERQFNATVTAYSFYKTQYLYDGLYLKQCNDGLNISFAGKNWELGDKPLSVPDGYILDYGTVTSNAAYCLDGTDSYITVRAYWEQGFCLPNADGGEYQWGFSRMLTALVVIFQLVWAVSMYCLWLDAMLNSGLVKAGFRMTQLRGALSVSAAAESKLGSTSRRLVVEDEKMVTGEMRAKGSQVSMELLTLNRLKEWEAESHSSGARLVDDDTSRHGVYTAT